MTEGNYSNVGHRGPVYKGLGAMNPCDNLPLHDKKQKTYVLIDTATPDDSNVNTEETEKLSKYKDMEIDISKKWKLTTKIAPVITGALGTFKEGLDQSLQLLAGHLSATELQKVAQIGTAHSIGKCWGIWL
jgi:hypothetical protein